MRAKTFGLPIFAVPLILLASGVSTGTDLRIELSLRTARQGEVCFLRAWGPTRLISVHVEFNGEVFPLGRGRATGAYEGLIGIDLETPPGHYVVRVVATDEEEKVFVTSLPLKVKKVDFGTQVLTLPREMVDLDPKTLERVKEEAKRLEALFRTTRPEKLWQGSFIRPVEGEVSAGFGLNRIINHQRRAPHTGIDLRAKEGTPIWACNDGIVALVADFFLSGKSVVLDHGCGIYSVYFHLSEALVREGELVSKGSALGCVGSTGRSTGPHLHWGIRIKGARVDPLSLLKMEGPSVARDPLGN